MRAVVKDFLKMKYLHHTPNRKLRKYLYQVYVHLECIRETEKFSDNKVLNRDNSFRFPGSMHNWKLLNFSYKNHLSCSRSDDLVNNCTD